MGDIEDLLYTKDKEIHDLKSIIGSLENIIKKMEQSKKTVADEKIDEEGVKMKFKDAPIGARFKFIEENMRDDVYVKIDSHENGLVVKWNGNIEGHQSHCCWVDDKNGYDFDTLIDVI